MASTETIIGMDLSSQPDTVAYMVAEPSDDGFRYRPATEAEIASICETEGWPDIDGLVLPA